VRFNHVLNARAARECLWRGDCRVRLYEYVDQTRAILFGKQAGELQNARWIASVVTEDHNFAEFRLASGLGQRFSEIGRSVLGPEFCCFEHISLFGGATLGCGWQAAEAGPIVASHAPALD
jgi:hypothetical protein